MKSDDSLGLTVPYVRTALPLISTFSREAALFFGASTEEAGQIELAIEEAGLFIIDSIPADFAVDETFSVLCRRENDGVRFHLLNKGLPVNVDGLPEYVSDAPEEHLEGLGLHLMRSVMDDVQFLNHGRQGWRRFCSSGLKRRLRRRTLFPRRRFPRRSRGTRRRFRIRCVR
jgi:anti-sigma regulatory factor (Ser/Thr protein kinase)